MTISRVCHVPIRAEIQEHNLRGQLKAELGEFQELFRENPLLNDEMTGTIKNWCDLFGRALHRPTRASDPISVDEERVLLEFIGFLKDILKDPADRPLEEVSYVDSSNGDVCGYKTLCVDLASLPPKLKGRSPFHLDNPERFIVSPSPHPIVEAAVLWLKRRVEFEVSPHIDQEYQRLVASNTLPKLPTPKMVRLLERSDRLALERARREEALRPSFDEEGLILRADQVYEGTMKLLSELNAQAEDTVLSITAWDVQSMKQLHAQKDQISQELNASRARIDHLTRELNDVKEQISAEEREIREVELAKEKLRAAIKKKEKEKKKAQIRQLVTIGICIATPFALKEVVAEATSGGVRFTWALG